MLFFAAQAPSRTCQTSLRARLPAQHSSPLLTQPPEPLHPRCPRSWRTLGSRRSWTRAPSTPPTCTARARRRTRLRSYSCPGPSLAPQWTRMHLVCWPGRCTQAARTRTTVRSLASARPLLGAYRLGQSCRVCYVTGVPPPRLSTSDADHPVLNSAPRSHAPSARPRRREHYRQRRQGVEAAHATHGPARLCCAGARSVGGRPLAAPRPGPGRRAARGTARSARRAGADAVTADRVALPNATPSR